MFFRLQSCLALLAVSGIFCSSVPAAELSEEAVAARFRNYKPACFELLDCKSGKRFRYNAEQCARRLAPMSTFKIFNALAGLDCGFLKNADHPMKWDGEKRWADAWNQDQTLASAMRESVVWYFQKVAAGVGEAKMKKYLQAAHYGNEDISGGITQFWLASTLSISADEQVDFIKKLYFDELPFSKHAMTVVRQITELKKTAAGELHGKTGSDRENGKWVLGWFVGYVVHDGQPYIFATNIQGTDDTWGKKAREITEQILQESGLL
jgi:beta-lactamase class D